MIKKIILILGIELFCLCNIPYVFADQPPDSSDPIGEIAKQHSTIEEKPTADNTTNKSSQKDVIGNMLLQAVSLMGIPYKWGGSNPETGMDCSGLIRYVYQKSLGINLPRTAAEMAKVGKRVSIDKIQPGDLLFFNTRGFNSSHIGLYLGNNQFLQSQKTGTDIQITELTGYWRAKFNGAKRIVEEDEDSTQTFADVRNEPLPATKYVKRKSKRTTNVRKKSNKKTIAHKTTTSVHKKTNISKKNVARHIPAKKATTKKKAT